MRTSILVVIANLLCCCLLSGCGPSIRFCDSADDCLAGEACLATRINALSIRYTCRPLEDCAAEKKLSACAPSSCPLESMLEVCTRDPKTNCYVMKTRTCDQGSACYSSQGKPACKRICSKASDCGDGEDCRYLPSHSQVQCSRETRYLPASTLCVVKVLQAVVPEDNWDTIFNNKTKADPYVKITLPNAEYKTEEIEDSTNPRWDYTTPTNTYKAFSQMTVTLYDSDKGQAVRNSDDKIRTWDSSKHRWLLDGVKNKRFDLVQGQIRLSLELRCDQP